MWDLDYPRYVEDVLTAANGWLTEARFQNRRVVICCKPAFSLYVQEKYNDSLTRASRQVNPTAEGRYGAVTSERYQDISPIETADLLGSTFDSLASERPPLTPFMSLENGLSIRELDGRFDRALFPSKDEKLVQLPPQLNSTEDVPKPAQALFPNHIPGREVTQTETIATRSPMRVCDFCVSNILESAASSDQHRVSIDRADASLSQCTFCSSLYANMRDSLNTEKWPWYHWTF